MSPVSLDTSIVSESPQEQQQQQQQDKRTLDSSPHTSHLTKKHNSKPPKVKKRKYKPKKDLDPTSPLGVLNFEIEDLINELSLSKEDILNPINSLLNNEIDPLLFHRTVSNVKILKFTSNGDGLALIASPELDKITSTTEESSTTSQTETNSQGQKQQIVIVPFGIPGDIVTIKIYKTHPTYVESDLLHIEKNSELRHDSLIKCQYFGACSGCQYQNLTYQDQLNFKKQLISNAYKFFAQTIADKLPIVSETELSPLQYHYRTKLTPHFDMPRRKPDNFTRPNLGFGSKGRPTWRPSVPTQGNILDIEECVIGTEVINKGMEFERGKYEKEFNNYKKGATILLRENTNFKNSSDEIVGEVDPSTNEIFKLEVDDDDEDFKQQLVKTYVTRPRQIVKEIINNYQFEFSAGEFFQNNNSILPRVIEYVSDNLQLSHSAHENYLIDAYCGSGLFSLTLALSVTRSIGVEISADSVKFAQRNAQLNNITNCSFIVGKLEKIFADIDLPHDKTSIILDPPRKGCDEVFLSQLSNFKPVKIIYISCNVHSQARDLQYFLTGTSNGDQYKVESIKGFDFFPQTHHVESVAVLSLV